MGEKNNDGGQFFTPREVIRAMIRAVKPEIIKDGALVRIYDPCCGTGGFLAESYAYLPALNYLAENSRKTDLVSYKFNRTITTNFS